MEGLLGRLNTKIKQCLVFINNKTNYGIPIIEIKQHWNGSITLTINRCNRILRCGYCYHPSSRNMQYNKVSYLYFAALSVELAMFFSRKSNSSITNVCLFVHHQNPSTAWNHHPSSFFIHPSSFIITLHSSFLHFAT